MFWVQLTFLLFPAFFLLLTSSYISLLLPVSWQITSLPCSSCIFFLIFFLAKCLYNSQQIPEPQWTKMNQVFFFNKNIELHGTNAFNAPSSLELDPGLPSGIPSELETPELTRFGKRLTWFLCLRCSMHSSNLNVLFWTWRILEYREWGALCQTVPHLLLKNGESSRGYLKEKHSVERAWRNLEPVAWRFWVLKPKQLINIHIN